MSNNSATSSDAPGSAALTGVMSDHEQVMWNVERDPWLNPNGSALVLLDAPVDAERFRAVMAHAVAHQPGLTQRVVSPSGPLGRPHWAPDVDFDLDRHVQVRTLEAPGSERQLLDLATELYQQPLDRDHALWRFVLIDGLESGAGALWMLTHHAISDGIGQVEMASLYYALSPDEPTPEPVDLDEVVAERVAAYEASERPSVRSEALGLAKRQLQTTREAAAEVAMWGADPSRVRDRLGELATSVQGAAQALTLAGSATKVGATRSPLWSSRSEQRRLDFVTVPLDQMKAAAKTQDASINDGFVATMIEATIAYHAAHDSVLERVRASFIMSTRAADAASAEPSNAFTPVVVEFGGASLSWPERLVEVRDQIATAREAAQRTGGVSALSGFINVLPTAVVTRTARQQASSIDFATSNIRGVPFPLYVANAEVQHVITQGPLAGTPCNATAMSINGVFDIGLFTDPAAIADPAGFCACVQTAFDGLLALA